MIKVSFFLKNISLLSEASGSAKTKREGAWEEKGQVKQLPGLNKKGGDIAISSRVLHQDIYEAVITTGADGYKQHGVEYGAPACP